MVMENSKKQKVFSAAGIRLYKPLSKETQKGPQLGGKFFRFFVLFLTIGLTLYFY